MNKTLTVAKISSGLLINADDLGMNEQTNRAIIQSFKNGYINSTSLMVNGAAFEEAIDLVKFHGITQVGLHVDLDNLVEKLNKTESRKFLPSSIWSPKVFFSRNRTLVFEEIENQLHKMRQNLFEPTHINSHHHLHTIPTLFPVFLKIAKQHDIKLRLAQSYNEGNYIKYLYRKVLNLKIKNANLGFSDSFETVDSWLMRRNTFNKSLTVEIMVHPTYDPSGNLVDAWDDKPFSQLISKIIHPSH